MVSKSNGNQLEHIINNLSFLAGNKPNYYYKGGVLPIWAINVLAQPRKTFEHIHELSQDLVQKGILNPLTVAHFSRTNCVQYIELLNFMWGTSFSINDLRSYKTNGHKMFEVLIAGERRLRGWKHTWSEERAKCSQCQELWNSGCEDCREKYGQEKPGTCYRRHFGEKQIQETEVRFCVGISPIEAVMLQFSENTYVPPRPEEEADGYYRLFKIMNYRNKVSYSFLGSLVNRSADVIRNAVRFCELPESIQEAVKSKVISYGIAIELSRIKSAGVSEEEILWWMTFSITAQKTVADFNKSVTEFLRNRSSGQVSMLDVFSDEQKKELAKPHFRMIVERQVIMAIWGWINYLNKVLYLFESGKLGKEDSPFSERSPVKVYRKLLETQKRLYPQIEQFIPEKERDGIKQTLENTTEALETLLASDS